MHDAGQKLGGNVGNFHSYSVPEKTSVVKQFQRACETLGLAGTLRSTFGGSDNHNFLKAGIDGIVLSCGMQRVHSTEEHISVQELMCGVAMIA
jgi:tripeptide aminopeptidase